MLNDKYLYAYQQRYDSTKRAYVRMMNFYVRIANVAKFIAAGGSLDNNPDIKEEYDYLVGEFGEGIFQSEINKLKLIKEDADGHHF